MKIILYFCTEHIATCHSYIPTAAYICIYIHSSARLIENCTCCYVHVHAVWLYRTKKCLMPGFLASTLPSPSMYMTCTTCMYNMHVQHACTTYMYMHVQHACTTYMYNMHVQHACTTYMYNMHVQHTCTTCMYMTCTTCMYNMHVQDVQ